MITDFSILRSLEERILDLRVVTVEPSVNVGNFDKRVSVIAIVTLLKAGKMMQLQLNTNLTFATNPRQTELLNSSFLLCFTFQIFFVTPLNKEKLLSVFVFLHKKSI